MTDHVQMPRITITTTMQTVFEVPDGVTIEQVRHLALPVLSESVNETDALATLQQKAIDRAYLDDANGVHLSVEHTITDGNAAHAESIEIARLRAASEWGDIALHEKREQLQECEAERMQLSNVVQDLRTFISEQNELLQLGRQMLDRGIVSFDDQVEYRQKLAALAMSEALTRET